MNVCVQFLCGHVFFPQGTYPGMELLDHIVTLFNFLRTCSTVFQSRCSLLLCTSSIRGCLLHFLASTVCAHTKMFFSFQPLTSQIQVEGQEDGRYLGEKNLHTTRFLWNSWMREFPDMKVWASPRAEWWIVHVWFSEKRIPKAWKNTCKWEKSYPLCNGRSLLWAIPEGRTEWGFQSGGTWTSGAPVSALGSRDRGHGSTVLLRVLVQINPLSMSFPLNSICGNPFCKPTYVRCLRSIFMSLEARIFSLSGLITTTF